MTLYFLQYDWLTDPLTWRNHCWPPLAHLWSYSEADLWPQEEVGGQTEPAQLQGQRETWSTAYCCKTQQGGWHLQVYRRLSWQQETSGNIFNGAHSLCRDCMLAQVCTSFLICGLSSCDGGLQCSHPTPQWPFPGEDKRTGRPSSHTQVWTGPATALSSAIPGPRVSPCHCCHTWPDRTCPMPWSPRGWGQGNVLASLTCQQVLPRPQPCAVTGDVVKHLLCELLHHPCKEGCCPQCLHCQPATGRKAPSQQQSWPMRQSADAGRRGTRTAHLTGRHWGLTALHCDDAYWCQRHLCHLNRKKVH